MRIPPTLQEGPAALDFSWMWEELGIVQFREQATPRERERDLNPPVRPTFLETSMRNSPPSGTLIHWGGGKGDRFSPLEPLKALETNSGAGGDLKIR